MTIVFLLVRICCVIGQENNYGETLCEILVMCGCAMFSSGLVALHWYSIEEYIVSFALEQFEIEWLEKHGTFEDIIH